MKEHARLRLPLRGLIFLALSMINAGRASNYYVDAAAGNDANNGVSPQTAWRTLAKVNASRFNPGDSVLLKRGERWRERLDVPSSGAPGSPITFSAYGAGENPIINGAILLTNWSRASGNVWSAVVDPPPVFVEEVHIVVFDQVYGKRKPSRADLTNERDWHYDISNQRLDIFSTSNPATKYQNPGIEVSIQFGAFYLNNQDYITLNGLTLIYSNNNAVKTHDDDSDHIVVENCFITKSAGAGISSPSGSDDWTVRNNTVTYCGEELDRDGLYVNEGCNAWKIYDNVFAFNGGDDLALEGGTGHRIFRNKLGPSRSISMGLALEGGSDYEVYENEITGHDVAGIAVKAAQCKIFRNRIYDNSQDGILINSQAADAGLEIYYNAIWGHVNRGFSGISLWLGGSNAKISNNVLFGNDLGLGQHQGQQNVEIVNNIIASNVKLGLYRYSGTQRVSHNDCYGNGVNYSGLPDPRGSEGNISAELLFMDEARRDFRLQARSPCIDAGLSIGLVNDLEGEAVPQGQQVDIGAFEYKSISPPQDVRVIIKP